MRICGQARKWWPGLILLAIFWVVAIWTETGRMESDVRARATAALNGTVLDKMTMTVSGRDVTLSAEAFSDEGRKSAVAMVDSAPGVRLVRDRTRLLPIADPYVWSARREIARLTLSGHVPLPASRGRLNEASRQVMGNAEISDQMTYARGAPQRFDAAALIALDQIGRLKEGEVRISGTGIFVGGMARDLGGREAIAAALRSLPEGFSVAEIAVKAPPYVIEAVKDPVSGKLALSGWVPDAATRDAVAAAVTRKFVDETVDNQLKLSAGAPNNLSAALVVSLGELARLSTGKLVISDTSVKLSGDALYDAAAEQVKSGFVHKLPKGYAVETDISVKPAAGAVDAAVCQDLFNQLLGRATVRFESGSATLNPDSIALMDRLVEIAMRCPNASLDIEGHTDADGDDRANLALSERRARSVADYLIKAGLPAERLHAAGFGETRPLASNETADGKAKNRRIEFVVK